MLNFFKSIFGKKSSYENLPAQAFLERASTTPGAVLLDVRTPAELAAGKLPGAVNLDFRDPSFEAEVAKLERGRPYFVYCRSGVRSVHACRKMQEMGFEKLVNLSGGYLSVQ